MIEIFIARHYEPETTAMFDPEQLKRLAEEKAAWEAGELAEFLARQPEARTDYRSGSGLPVQRLYTPEDIADAPTDNIGLPGRYPYTRGPYPTMYRGRNWTMRQIAGFGTGEDTNRRFRYLIEQGQTGLSVDFDMPTLMGYDPDNLSGTVQADILKEYQAQKEWIFPIRPSMRVVRDLIVYSARNLARYNPINISGYHISEAGANAVQELAFTMCNAVAYLQEVTQAGVQVDEFAPRLAFYFVAQQDFFEEIAKFRAARRCWAKIAKRFGAQKPESMRLRFHCQTAAATLTKPQPMNNVVRTAIQALSAVLGGCQSLHTNGLDEAYAIPSEMAMKLALRTQQIIADETRVAQVADPLGGSWYVESLTKRIEDEVFAILDKVETMGGTVRAVEQGYFQREIAETAYRTARKKASGELPVLGVNKYVDPPKQEQIEIHKIDPEVEQRQIARTQEIRRKRDGARVSALLDRLEREARDPSVNLMPVTIDLVKAGATMGEIVARLKVPFGTYVETPVF